MGSKKQRNVQRHLSREATATAATKSEASLFHKYLLALQVAAYALAGWWIYSTALHGTWLWDDDVLVLNHYNLRTLSGLWHIWTGASEIGYWPVTWTFLWAQWHLWGEQTFGYHLVNLLLHLGSALLVWRLFNTLGMRWGWLGGLLFVVHPLCVESVAWITEVKNTLSLPLYLLSFLLWIDQDGNKSWRTYLLSIAFFAAATLAKTSTVMLPVILLLYIWWKNERISWVEARKTIPYFAISLIMGLVTIFVRNTQAPESEILRTLSWDTRIWISGSSLTFYIGKFFFPTDLLPVYPKESFDLPTLLQIFTWPLLLALVGSLWFLPRYWRRHALFGIVFFAVNLFPVLGFFNISYNDSNWLSDHHAYLPLIGLVGLCVAFAESLYKRLTPLSRPYAVAAIFSIVVCLAYASHQHASHFASMEKLWTYTLEKTPRSPVALINLGATFSNRGELDKAIVLYEKAILADSHYLDAYNNLALALTQKGFYDQAIATYQDALKISPSHGATYNNLANTYLHSDHLSDAVANYHKAISLTPDRVEIYLNLGTAYTKMGFTDDAILQFEKTLKLSPNHPTAHNNLGMALVAKERVDDGIAHYKASIRIDPLKAQPYNNLGLAYMKKGDTDNAIAQYREAIRINPLYPEAYSNLGVALFSKGLSDQAVIQFEKAVQLAPENTTARNNLDTARALMQKQPAR